jgi:hypothetical protein
MNFFIYLQNRLIQSSQTGGQQYIDTSPFSSPWIKGSNPATGTSGLYDKPATVVNDDSSIINKLETSLTDNARVIIDNRHMFIVQTKGDGNWQIK